MTTFQVFIDPDLEPIIPRYLEIRLEELARLEQAIQASDGEAIHLLGHKLKGTGSSYGFDRLTELGAAIDIAGKAGRIDEAATLTAEVRSYLENLEIVYREQD